MRSSGGTPLDKRRMILVPPPTPDLGSDPPHKGEGKVVPS